MGGLVYDFAMRRSFLHCLIVLVLLMQGVGSAWAGTRMAAGEVQVAAHIAQLPPCHQQAAKDHAKATMNCCGTGNCHCVFSCGGAPALSLSALTALFTQQAEVIAERPQAALPTGFYGPPLRPPAALL